MADFSRTLNEDSGAVTQVVTLDDLGFVSDVVTDIDVQYHTSGTASEGIDYIVQYDTGDDNVTITLTIVDDDIVETGGESFSVNITGNIQWVAPGGTEQHVNIDGEIIVGTLANEPVNIVVEVLIADNDTECVFDINGDGVSENYETSFSEGWQHLSELNAMTSRLQGSINTTQERIRALEMQQYYLGQEARITMLSDLTGIFSGGFSNTIQQGLALTSAFASAFRVYVQGQDSREEFQDSWNTALDLLSTTFKTPGKWLPVISTIKNMADAINNPLRFAEEMVRLQKDIDELKQNLVDLEQRFNEAQTTQFDLYDCLVNAASQASAVPASSDAFGVHSAALSASYFAITPNYTDGPTFALGSDSDEIFDGTAFEAADSDHFIVDPGSGNDRFVVRQGTYFITDSGGDDSVYVVGKDGFLASINDVALQEVSLSTEKTLFMIVGENLFVNSSGIERFHFKEGTYEFSGPNLVFDSHNVTEKGVSLQENSISGSAVTTIELSDDWSGLTPKLELLNNSGGLFELSGLEVVVADEANLDFETATSHILSVEISDDSGKVAVEEILVRITNVPINDIVMTSGGVIRQDDIPGTVVAEFEAFENPLEPTSTFEIVDGGDGKFVFDGNSLRVASDAVFDPNVQSQYALVIAASDASGPRYEETFEILVENVGPIVGTPGPDILTGTPGNDVILALASNDVINASFGNDDINGGPGTDTVAYARSRSEVSHDLQGNGSVIVSRNSADGTDMLVAIERIAFTDGTLYFDIDTPNRDFGYRIYQASFGRTPDEGVLFWIGVLDDIDRQGWSEYDKQQFLATQFINSDEFRSLYGPNPTHEQYIDAMYLNVLFRLPDEEGRDFWIGGMQQGLTRQDILIAFTQSDENVLNNAGNLDDGVWIV